MLSPKQNRLARRVAIAAWCSGDRSPTALESRFKNDERVCKLDPATIILLLQIAFQLWKWWQDRKVDSPTMVPMQGEPNE